MKKIETGWQKLGISASPKWRFDGIFWWAPHGFKWRLDFTKHHNGSKPSSQMANGKRNGEPNGCLVSAGPTISSAIPPLHPRLVNPLIPETADSLVEKGARETLRLLISSTSQANSQFMSVLPVALTNTEQTSILANGSWSLYTGTRDVDGIANKIATMGLVSLSESSIGNGVAEIRGDCDNTISLPDKLPDGSSVLDGPYSDDEGTLFSNAGKGTN